MSSRVLAEEAREAQTMIFYLLMQEDSVMEVHPTDESPDADQAVPGKQRFFRKMLDFFFK